ncbi:MAG: hypothetical protein H0U74_12915 [Bradymonadaceae bacterium]|nr:hypothetical protein [Lujinxingiaceae bacterium]
MKRPVVVVTLCLLLLPSLALAQTEVDDREADMFGETTTATENVNENETVIETVNATVNENAISHRLAEHHDPLAIGGRMYFRLQQSFIRETPNENVLTQPSFSSPALVDLYLDARPNDRLRGFASGRLQHDFSLDPNTPPDPLTGRTPEQNRVALDQLWLRFDIANTVYVTAGRQHLRWGTGRFWNPTDFLYAQRRDPLAIVDERLGTTLLKLHLPIASLGWNFYAVANLDGVSSPDDIGAALRAEFLIGPGEFALSAAAQKNRPVQVGADLSFGLGPFDIRGELALLNNVRETFWRGQIDLETLSFPEAYSRKDDWIVQATVGAEVGINYSDQDAIYFGAEYFFNDAGYSDNTLYPWLLLQRSFRPLYTGRHYAALYAMLPSPGSWNDTSFTLSALSNLSDNSLLTRFDYRVRVLTHLSVFAWTMLHTGSPGEFRFGMEVPALPIDGLEDGITIPEPLLSIGAGMTMTF